MQMHMAPKQGMQGQWGAPQQQQPWGGMSQGYQQGRGGGRRYGDGDNPGAGAGAGGRGGGRHRPQSSGAWDRARPPL